MHLHPFTPAARRHSVTDRLAEAVTLELRDAAAEEACIADYAGDLDEDQLHTLHDREQKSQRLARLLVDLEREAWLASLEAM
jgi:hypothetical protein